jgi:hypothetical protein
MGGSTILRGKFSIVGREKDHLYMQIWRFGFGRNVSGSVFSEGNGLSKDDEMTYWGRIQYVDENGMDLNEASVSQESCAHEIRNDRERVDRLMVKGSVIFGHGLEPQPVGLFVMTESIGTNGCDDDDDGEEGGVEDDGHVGDGKGIGCADIDSDNIFQ